MKSVLFFALALLVARPLGAENSASVALQKPRGAVIDAGSLRGKVLCGYQGWFRCPGDKAKEGWIHWSRNAQQLTPETLTFEMWPDMTDYPTQERFAVPGFQDAEGQQAYLFSNDQPGTVRRHFEWMRDHGIEGVWLQHFLVDLPGGPVQERYASRRRVLSSVRAAAQQTGRVWAIAFDIAGMPSAGIFEALTSEWKKLVAEGVLADGRYLHEGGKPVVQIWGFYYQDPHNAMTAKVANQLIDFVTYEGLPSDWSLRLVGEGTRLLHEQRLIPAEIPMQP